MENKTDQRTNIIGAGEVSFAMPIELEQKNIHEINGAFWDAKGNDVIGTTAFPLYDAFISEEKHHLFGDVSSKNILEIGCGTEHYLKYLGERKALELCEIEISDNQIKKTNNYLSSNDFSAKLICSLMENTDKYSISAMCKCLKNSEKCMLI